MMKMTPSNTKDELIISMEEGRSNIIVNRVGHDQGQTRQPESSQPCSNSDFRCAGLRNKFPSLKDIISKDKQENDKPEGGIRPKIQRASDMLRRDENIKQFEPRMISIGPLHHGDKFKQGKKLKLKLAAHFIDKHKLDEVDLYNKINGQIETLRKCYFQEDIEDFSNDALAWMFLVDGCALIHYIDCVSNEKLRDLKIKMDMEAFAKQDLFLLENQLPYKVLDILITSIADQTAKKDVKASISTFVGNIARDIRGDPSLRSPSPSQSSPKRNTPAHLLELLWEDLVGDNKRSEEVNKPKPPPRTYTIRRRSRNVNEPKPPPVRNTPAHFLEHLWQLFVGVNKRSDDVKPHGGNRFRNVNELKAAWIQFKPYTEGSLSAISFRSCLFTGTLRLPFLAVDDSTGPMFLNLIAFEMCPDFENYFQVSSYISFLDSLIDQPDDVKDLRKANILYNALGSDEQLAKLFNEISTDVVFNPQTYKQVKEDIQTHCNKKWKTWMAQALHEHFSSPWTFLAFAAAIAALGMSFVQTWFTIYPSK